MLPIEKERRNAYVRLGNDHQHGSHCGRGSGRNSVRQIFEGKRPGHPEQVLWGQHPDDRHCRGVGENAHPGKGGDFQRRQYASGAVPDRRRGYWRVSEPGGSLRGLRPVAEGEDGQRQGQGLCERLCHRLLNGLHRGYGNCGFYSGRPDRRLFRPCDESGAGFHHHYGYELLPGPWGGVLRNPGPQSCKEASPPWRGLCGL